MDFLILILLNAGLAIASFFVYLRRSEKSLFPSWALAAGGAYLMASFIIAILAVLLYARRHNAVNELAKNVEPYPHADFVVAMNNSWIFKSSDTPESILQHYTGLAGKNTNDYRITDEGLLWFTKKSQVRIILQDETGSTVITYVVKGKN